ncbi:MAG: response regulator [Leptolyngbyaceae cyanobacterium]
MRLLLIEDDEILADQLVMSLTHHQYAVDAVFDGREGLEYAQATLYDLIISDVGLPNLNGISLCRQLRNQGYRTPILLMTAKNAPEERIQALDAGADDHLTKPLNLAEVQARVRALLRRREVASETVLQKGPLQLNPITCQVTFADSSLKLTPKEYGMLEMFMRSPGRVFSRSYIVEHLWNFDEPPLEDSVKAHIKGLRRKLKQAGADGWVENVYGIGYRFTPQAAAESAAQPATEPEAKPLAAAPPPVSITSSEPEALQQAFQVSMAGLWHKYQELMQERIAVLTQAATAIETSTLTAPLQAAAGRAAHKLAGVLGMFERDEGTDLAREIESLLKVAQSDHYQQVPLLVQQLIEQIQPPAERPAVAPAAEGETWLVTPDNTLAETLRSLGQTTGMSWQHHATVEAAAAALPAAPPEVAIIDIAAASMWSASLGLIQQLSQQQPAVPTVALVSGDSLMDRVAIAQAGIQRLLTKPATTDQVWDAVNQVRRRQTAQLLAVDDDPLILQALRSLLEPWGIAVTGLDAPQQFWQVLTATQPDLLILDVAMPDFTGLELCQAVRTDPHWQDLPVLFLTSHRDGETVQQIFRAGGDDYLAKPIVGPELLTRILSRLERRRLFRSLSQQDRVTRLANYSHAKQAFTQLCQTALTQSQPACFALFRLSMFSSLYSRYGHEGCHAILQAWGQRFRMHLPDLETLAYWENGEFVIGLSAFTLAEAQTYLEPLRQALRREIVTLSSGERVQPEFDWAMVACPEEGCSVETLYKGAIAKLNAELDDETI